MINKVKIKNYKSLVNFTANFGKTTDSGNIAIIYGENGSGKTNFLSAIQAIALQTNSLNIRTLIMEEFRDIGDELPEFKNINELFNIGGSIESLFSKMITIGEETGSITLEFVINKKNAEYTLEFNKEGLVRERLYYILNENRGQLYNIKLNDKGRIDKTISPQLSSDKDLSKLIDNQINQFWGRYSLLSIIDNIVKTRNVSFWTDGINPNVLDVLNYFDHFFVKNLPGEKSLKTLSARLIESESLYDLGSGHLPDSQESRNKLEKAEEILFNFLSPLFSDIVDVKYKTNLEEDKLEYRLFMSKIISKKKREIPLASESSGTKNIIELLPFISEYIRGGVVLIDEIENAIHDLLIKDMIESIINLEDVKGQLIATTHNTMIMEQIDDRNIFVLADDGTSKSLNQISSYSETRIRANHNVRTRYLDGLYRGVPFTRGIDFDLISELVDE